jgi:hypothetical protein
MAAKKTTEAKTAAPKVAAPKPPAKPQAPKKPAGNPGAEGTRDNPWILQTPPGTSEFEAFRDESADALVIRVGKTELRYSLRCIEDLRAMLIAHGDWMSLGGTDEQKPAPDGSVEAWARGGGNPVGGWYGTKKGLRGRFGVYVPPVLEVMGLAEVEHNPKNNRMRVQVG